MSYDTSDSDTSEAHGANTTRRKLMAAGAASWATVGLAGCSGNGGDGTAAPTDEPTAEPTDEPTAEPQPSDLIATSTMVTGSDNIPGSASFVSACTPTWTFSPGMHAIWDIGIYNPDTGEIADPERVESVQVTMSSSDVDAADGQSVEAAWQGDADENPHDYWSGAWTIPEDAAAGSVEYDVEVETAEGDGHFVGVSTNSFTIEEVPKYYVIQTHPKSVSDNSTDGFQNGCGPEWQFIPGQDVHFVAEVWNPLEMSTHAAPAGDTWGGTIDSVTLTFPDGEFDDREMQWAVAEDAEDVAEADRVFEATLTLPEDAEAKTYDFDVTVEAVTDSVLDTTSSISTFNVIDPSA